MYACMHVPFVHDGSSCTTELDSVYIFNLSCEGRVTKTLYMNYYHTYIVYNVYVLVHVLIHVHVGLWAITNYAVHGDMTCLKHVHLHEQSTFFTQWMAIRKFFLQKKEHYR